MIRMFFNLLIPAVFMVIFPYQIWEKVHQPDPDKSAIVVQSLLLLFIVGIFTYRVLQLRKKLS